MEVLGITPARGGSKRVPQKNVRPVGGHPLIVHTFRSSLASKLLTRYVVSTEDDEIRRIATECGVEVVARPPALASDTAATIPVLQDTVARLREGAGYHPDIVVQLNATSPLRMAADIDNVVRMMIDTGCDAVTSLVRTMRIDRICRLAADGGVDFCWPYRDAEMGITRTQECPRYYVGNGAITAVRTRHLRAGDSWKAVFYDQGLDLRGYEMPPERSVDIDTEQDLRFVEFMLLRRSQTAASAAALGGCGDGGR